MDSAGGSANQCRNTKNQAVFKLKGKIQNTNGETSKDVLDNKEIADLTYAITGQRDAIGDKFNLDLLKYERVIMLCDADSRQK